MNIKYDTQVLDDLKQIDPLQARMLLDYFENKYHIHDKLDHDGRVFKTATWRILFIQDKDTLTVLRIIR